LAIAKTLAAASPKDSREGFLLSSLDSNTKQNYDNLSRNSMPASETDEFHPEWKL